MVRSNTEDVVATEFVNAATEIMAIMAVFKAIYKTLEVFSTRFEFMTAVPSCFTLANV